MSKKNDDRCVSEQSKMMGKQKLTFDTYYLKSDADKNRLYKISGVRTHFYTGEVLVHFYVLNAEEPTDYILEIDDFIEKFAPVDDQ